MIKMFKRVTKLRIRSENKTKLKNSSSIGHEKYDLSYFSPVVFIQITI